MRRYWSNICRAALGIVLAAYTLTILLASSGLAGESRLSGLTGTLWVTKERDNAVAKVEAATGRVLAVISVGKNPVDLVAPKGTAKLYVSNEFDGTVSVIDKATATVTKKISVGSTPHHMHRSSDGKFVYVALFGADKVAVISTANDTLVGEYVTGLPGARPRTPRASSDGKTLWVTNFNMGEIVELNAATGTILRTIKAGRGASDVLLTKDGKTAYVSPRYGNELQIIDLSSNTIVREIDLGSIPGSFSLSPDGTIMVIGLRDSPAMAAIVDTSAMTVKQVSLPGFTTGHNAVSGDGRFAFIAVEGLSTGSKALVTKPDEIRKYFERALSSGRVERKLDHSVMVLSDTVVVVTGLETVTGVRGGKPFSATGRVTFVVAKRGSDWQIAHFHRSRLPN